MEDGFFGAVGAVFGFALAFDDGEGAHLAGRKARDTGRELVKKVHL